MGRTGPGRCHHSVPSRVRDGLTLLLGFLGDRGFRSVWKPEGLPSEEPHCQKGCRQGQGFPQTAWPGQARGTDSRTAADRKDGAGPPLSLLDYPLKPRL